MRHSHLLSTMIVASAFTMVGALAPYSVPAQAPTAGPYKTIALKLPTPMNDASFEAFRKQLADIAKRKDRAALAQLVATNFFLTPVDTDIADKSKPAIENLAKAVGLDAQDGHGWETIADFAEEATAAPARNFPAGIRAPAPPTYDHKAAEDLAAATRTEPSDWMYPVRDGVEVRSAAQQTAEVIEKIGLHLVRALHEDANAFVKIQTPSGKSGFVTADAVRDLAGSLLCYVKEASGWKIAGYFGGDPDGAN